MSYKYTNAAFIRRNRWILDRDVLAHFIRSNAERYPDDFVHKVEKDGVCTTYMSVSMRSTFATNVAYEILLVESGKVFINICTDTEGDVKRVCVYRDGVLARWGIWAAELLITLPQLVADSAKKEADKAMDELVQLGIVEECEMGAEADKAFSDAEFEIIQAADCFEGSVQENIYTFTRSGSPAKHLA